MQVGIADARRRLKEILDRVGAGESVEITRRGEVVARVVPPARADTVEPLGRHIESWRSAWEVDDWPDDDPFVGLRDASSGRDPWS